ncbi:tripartite ATP-independent transporter DctM subunit [Tamaricihabitans halophyticus]|uniref:Tripartite ATP-independent transporter DctM subunit n=1 Tax=Tamaricihabitans halophyticus TaxID=1262583 RepID=A0A4R2Q6F1_9PSEU|nr:TRAP transporter large permease [Tamaricihabitans halophyticus]TCP43428.1 tripartite ATP-independent transporter DctM subunit [Tamaricihabitans halophyticus]
MLLVFVILLLFILLLIRMPVGFAIGLAGLAGLLLHGGMPAVLGFLETTPHSAVATYTLSPIPLFILMAQLVLQSGVATELFDAARVWVGRIPAGLGVATTTSGAAFSAVSGSSTAAAATLAATSIPEMEKRGYEPRLASGLVAVVGTLASMVPPSIILVFYAILAEESVSQVLIAGFLPGILVTIAIIITTLLVVRRKPDTAPRGESHPMRAKIRTIPAIGPVALLFVLVIGTIYFGLATPTEAAALGALGALLIGLARRRLTVAGIRAALLNTLKSSAMILLIILAAYLFGYFLTLTEVTSRLVESISSLAAPPTVIFLLIVVIYLVLGAFMDQIAILALTVPVVLPVVEELGYDPIWFGVMIVLIAEIGLVTPPLGLNVFIVARATGRRAEEVFRGVVPYVGALLVLVLVFLAFPQLVLWLPEMMVS